MSYQGAEGEVVATNQDTYKPDLTSTTMLRMILDYAGLLKKLLSLLNNMIYITTQIRLFIIWLLTAQVHLQFLNGSQLRMKQIQMEQGVFLRFIITTTIQ